MARNTPNPTAETHEHGFECLATAARVLDRALTGLYEDALRPLGLRAPQLTLLFVVESRPGVTAAELADFLVIDRSTLSRTLAHLVGRGLIREDDSTEDGRVRHLHVTAAGKRLTAKARPVWKETQAKAIKLLGKPAAEGILKSAVGLMTTPTRN